MADQQVPGSRVDHLLVDRDGVLNREEPGRLVHRPEDWHWEPGARRAMELLAQRQTAVSVVTNQSAVARGELDKQDLRALHEWLTSELEHWGVAVVGVFSCLHDRDAGCHCRKPAPGLLLDAITASGIAPEHTALVGDDLRDLDAAEAAGVRSVLVRTGKGAASELKATRRITVTDDLHTAVRLLRTCEHLMEV
ncbi:MAG: HAD-IIIA family hydrolase [Microthrixaceae bacterium]|nr:HAD-IIIA family hydrolase [Microthrixaceae bacterium]